jgi:MYXO-CTERM domain-containing protein
MGSLLWGGGLRSPEEMIKRGGSTRSSRAAKFIVAIALALFALLATARPARAQSCDTGYSYCSGGWCCPDSATCCNSNPKRLGCTSNGNCSNASAGSSSTGSGSVPAGCGTSATFDVVPCGGNAYCPANSTCTAAGGCVCDSGYERVDCSGNPCASSTCNAPAYACVASTSGSSSGGSTGTSLCANGLTCSGGQICCNNQCYAAGSTCCPEGQGCNTSQGEQCCGAACVSAGFICCDPTGQGQGCVADLEFCCGGACCANGNTCNAGTCSAPPPPKKSGCNTTPEPAPSESGFLLVGLGAFVAAAFKRRR